LKKTLGKAIEIRAMSAPSLVLVLLVFVACGSAFSPQGLSPARRALERSHLLAMAKKGKDPEPEKPKMTLGALVQLMTMGAGAPSLGEFRGMKGTTAMFELEANNFSDENGNVRRGKYFEDGYVEDPSTAGAPNFFANLMSGGKLQREYEDRKSSPPRRR
jgi:hypothetical protein